MEMFEQMVAAQHGRLDIARHLDRLTPHPSLAGWFVGHLGAVAERVARRIRSLDPTRAVFRDAPVQPAA